MKQASLPLQDLQTWCHFNDVQLLGASIEANIIGEDGNSKGGGLLAKASYGPGEPLAAIPLDLVLSKDRVEECAKADKDLKELIEAAASLFQTPRTAVLLFLIYQMTINSPDCDSHGLGYKNPFADYIQLLPKEIPLPTFYSSEEKELLKGTSLSAALDQKMSRLEREFETLKSATETIPWCQRVWWDGNTGCLELADWVLADAIYRSRAMELPRGVGLGMVPVVDMANHASDERYNARFEVHEDAGVVMLVVRDKTSIKAGDEITIMYGPGGACEMVFSYGFLDQHASSARELFLDLSIPSDDPLRMAKIRFAQEAPGVRLYMDSSGQVQWESTFVWWACINQEDGLDFEVEQTVDGGTELKALWKDQDLQADALQSILLEDACCDVFTLRAVVLIQQRVEDQGTLLAATEDAFEHAVPNPRVRSSIYDDVGRLRKLELELLTRAYESLEQKKAQLLDSAVVRKYLKNPSTPEDFS